MIERQARLKLEEEILGYRDELQESCKVIVELR
jgi:hypothetical protein